jgi:hypothetical protein
MNDKHLQGFEIPKRDKRAAKLSRKKEKKIKLMRLQARAFAA